MEGLARLRERYNNMILAQASFEREIALFKKYDDPRHELYKSMRNSLIKTFELSIDPFWKFLRDYLSSKYGIVIENPGPKSVYRAANDLPEYCKIIGDVLGRIDL